MDNITPMMDTPNWGNLPTEVLKMIFEYVDDYFEYQLVNKQWYFASLGVAYKDITIDEDLTDDHNNWKRLESFCRLLKNPSYNIGHYVKELTFESSNNNLHILGLIMDHCANVEIITVTPTKALNKYIASAQRNGTVVWSKLKEVTCMDPTDDFYHLMYLFRNSIQEVCLSSTPSIPTNDESDGEDEHTSGTEENIYAYLKELDLKSSDNRVDDRSANILSLSQTQLQSIYAYKPFTGLKKLVLRNYTPKSALLEFMYIKHKFVHLEEILIYREWGMFWEPLSPLLIDIVTEYVFTVPNFELCISLRINLEVVQRFFESYMKRKEKLNLMINFSTERGQCVKFTSNNKGWPTANTPQMQININQERLLQHPVNPQAIEEFRKILKYAGPYLQALKLDKLLPHIIVHETANREDSFDAQLMEEILSACLNLQHVVLDMDRYLERCKVEKEPHTGIQTIEFAEDTRFEDGFFHALSTRLPNLKYMTVQIQGYENQLQLDHINVPFTNFTKLTVHIRKLVLEADSLKEDGIVVCITTKKENNITRYYQCCIPTNTDYCKLKLKFTLIKIPPKTDTVIFGITCSIIRSFILVSAPYDCILNF